MKCATFAKRRTPTATLTVDAIATSGMVQGENTPSTQKPMYKIVPQVTARPTPPAASPRMKAAMG